MHMNRKEIFTFHISPYVAIQGTLEDLDNAAPFRFRNTRTGEVDYTPDPDRFLDNRSPFEWELEGYGG